MVFHHGGFTASELGGYLSGACLWLEPGVPRGPQMLCAPQAACACCLLPCLCCLNAV